MIIYDYVKIQIFCSDVNSKRLGLLLLSGGGGGGGLFAQHGRILSSPTRNGTTKILGSAASTGTMGEFPDFVTF